MTNARLHCWPADEQSSYADPTQQIAELPRASLGYKQLNKTARIATQALVPHLQRQLVRVRHASSSDGATRRVEQLRVVHYSVDVMI